MSRACLLAAFLSTEEVIWAGFYPGMELMEICEMR